MCTRTVCSSSYLARPRSENLLVMIMAAAPMRKSVFGISMLRSLPLYLQITWRSHTARGRAVAREEPLSSRHRDAVSDSACSCCHAKA